MSRTKKSSRDNRVEAVEIKHEECRTPTQLYDFYNSFSQRMRLKFLELELPLEKVIRRKCLNYGELLRNKQRSAFRQVHRGSYSFSAPCDVCAEYAKLRAKISQLKPSIDEKRTGNIHRNVFKLFRQIERPYATGEYPLAMHMVMSAITYIKAHEERYVPEKDLYLSIAYSLLARISTVAGLRRTAIEWHLTDLEHCRNNPLLWDHFVTVHESIGETHMHFGEVAEAVRAWDYVPCWTKDPEALARIYLLIAKANVERDALESVYSYAQQCVTEADKCDNSYLARQGRQLMQFAKESGAVPTEQ